ncbi:hypothetical protein HNP33_002059 [Comamonas odontotermitis]|uniref:Thioester domain-containing protein n=1 Tax=Comamonas odontotermitis TaxID=379895 RepID=A0ABR6RFQ2_9BURK|nr:hypothetical protein [Comamonas odontotermitis]MBB6577991.1 hypothetical protein [Comamonas odontotermitis]
MLRQTILSFLVTLGVGFANSSTAAPLTGTSAWSGDFAESAISTDLKYADGTPYSDLPVFMICIDVTKTYPVGSVSYQSEAGGSALKGGSGEAGVAAVNWLFDQYYATYFKGGSDAQKWAFQYAIWELGNDYNGAISSISATSGLSRPFEDGYKSTDPEFIAAYQAMYQAMTSTLPTLGGAYRSKTYTIDLFGSTDPTYQSMVALVEKPPVPPAAAAPTPVPGLSSVGLFVLTGFLSMVAVGGISRNRTSKKKV